MKYVYILITALLLITNIVLFINCNEYREMINAWVEIDEINQDTIRIQKETIKHKEKTIEIYKSHLNRLYSLEGV